MINAEKLEKSIENVLQKVDELLDSEETELIGDIVNILSKLNKGIIYFRKKNFFRFLKGLSFDSMTEKELNKLSMYIDSKMTSEYLLQFITDLLSSKSNKSCFLAGLYTAKLIQDDKEIDFEAVNILGFLSSSNDYDIDNLKFANDYFDEDDRIDNKIYSALEPLIIDSLFEKCCRFSIMGKEYSSDGVIEIEDYQPTHPMETGYRSSYPVEIQNSYYKTKLFDLIVELISKGKV